MIFFSHAIILAMNKNVKSPEERRRLIRSIFGHISALPEKEIKDSVILVSYTDDHAFAFQKITGRTRLPSDYFPFYSALEQGVKLIDPTTALLRPEVDVNFVTMHYLMTFVQRAKFVFVFNAADTEQMPYDNIKRMLTQFISLFKLEGNSLARLAESCGLIITDASEPASVYAERLGGKNYNMNLLEEGYLTKDYYESVKKVVKGVLQNERVLLCNAKKKDLITGQFLTLVNKLEYFQMAGSVTLSLQSAYQEYVGFKIHRLWEDIFKSIYNSLDALVIDNGQQRTQQQDIMKIIKDFNQQRSKAEDDPFFQGEKKPEYKSIKLLTVLDSMTRLIMKFINNEIVDLTNVENNRYVLNEFLDMLYSLGFIKNPFIRSFLTNYFLIRRFLSKEDPTGANNDDYDLFQRVSFCDIFRTIDHFHPKMREISVAVLRELETDLGVINKSYPVKQCMILLSSILQRRDVKELTFFTDRVTKKLLKHRANIAYSLIKLSQRSKKDHLRSELNFLRWSSESRLIKDKLKVEILIDIALSLAEEATLVPLALSVLLTLPEYEVYQHVKYIYEKLLKLNVEVLQYLPEEERKQLLQQHFEGYYTFFLRIGFQETVREMSMECLRLSETEEEREFFKNALVKARGSGFRDLHNNFLENSILQEKEVVLDSAFIDNLEAQMVGHGLI